MTDFTGFTDGDDSNLQVSQDSSENLSSIFDTEAHEFDNVLDSDQSVGIDHFEDQEHKYNQGLVLKPVKLRGRFLQDQSRNHELCLRVKWERANLCPHHC